MNDGFVTSRVYPGDTNALVKNLMKATGIGDPNVLVRSINSGEWVLTKVKKAMEQAVELLSFIDRVTVEVVSEIDLANFFTERVGFDVSSDFQKILPDSDQIRTGEMTISKYRLGEKTYDSVVVKKLPKGYLFEEGEFFPVLATMLLNQWGGGYNELINHDAYPTLFYVLSKDKKQVFTVSCYWEPTDLHWVVQIHGFDEAEWSAGSVVVSRT